VEIPGPGAAARALFLPKNHECNQPGFYSFSSDFSWFLQRKIKNNKRGNCGLFFSLYSENHHALYDSGIFSTQLQP
jgi:hypothetical protein